MASLRKLILFLLLGCIATSPSPAQQWVHLSFSDDAVARMLSAPVHPDRSEATVAAERPCRRVHPDTLERLHLEVEQTVADSMTRLGTTYERAKERVMPPRCLWPDTGWRLFNPGFDQWGIKGIPCRVSP